MAVKWTSRKAERNKPMTNKETIKKEDILESIQHLNDKAYDLVVLMNHFYEETNVSDKDYDSPEKKVWRLCYALTNITNTIEVVREAINDLDF